MTINDKNKEKLFCTALADMANLLGHYMMLVTNNYEDYEEMAEMVSTMMTVLTMTAGFDEKATRLCGKLMSERRDLMRKYDKNTDKELVDKHLKEMLN